MISPYDLSDQVIGYMNSLITRGGTPEFVGDVVTCALAQWAVNEMVRTDAVLDEDAFQCWSELLRKRMIEMAVHRNVEIELPDVFS